MSQDTFRNPPIDVTPPAPPPRPAEPVREPQMANSALQRFLGGPPVAVFLRLLFVSLVVGALLVWLDIRPFQIFNALQRFVNRLWMMGWDAVRDVAQYIIAGAVIVLPVWLVMRLLSMRGAK